MGGSGWNYTVPYQPDLQAALDQLRQATFASGDYHWPREPDPLPATLDALFGDDWVQQSGTHSILDVDRVLGPAEVLEHGTVSPIQDSEAMYYLGTVRLTRAHVETIEKIASVSLKRVWAGRFAVLHDESGVPMEIYFSGISGD